MTDTVTVQTVQKISTLEDGDLIEVVVKGEPGERVTLKFTPETLAPFVRRTTRHLIEARNRRQAKLGHPRGVQALVAGAARSAAVPGGSKVSVSFLADGMEFHFALAPSKAVELHTELGRAIADARHQAKQTRQ